MKIRKDLLAKMCDEYCRWPHDCDEEGLEEMCEHCPLAELDFKLKLENRKEKAMTNNEMMKHANFETALAFGDTDQEYIRINGFLCHVFSQRYIEKVLVSLINDGIFEPDFVEAEVEDYISRREESFKKYLEKTEEETANE